MTSLFRPWLNVKQVHPSDMLRLETLQKKESESWERAALQDWAFPEHTASRCRRS